MSNKVGNNKLKIWNQIRLIASSQFTGLILLVVALSFAALVEMVAIGAVPLYIGLLLEPSKIGKYASYIGIYTVTLNVEDIISSGAALLLFIYISKSLLVGTLAKIESVLLSRLSTRLTLDLLTSYLSQNYLFHKEKNPTSLIQNLTRGVEGTCLYIKAILYGIKEFSVAVVIFSLLLATNWRITILSVLILGSTALLYHLYTRRQLERGGKIVSNLGAQELKILGHLFGSLKESILYERSSYFSEKLRHILKEKNSRTAELQFLGSIPRLMFEAIAMFVLCLVIVTNFVNGTAMAETISMLSLMAFSLIRTIPALNGVTLAATNIKYYGQFMNEILLILKNNKSGKGQQSTFETSSLKSESCNLNTLNLNNFDSIEFRDVCFSYPNTNQVVLRNINFKLQSGDSVGIIGPSGSGKSTLVDLMLGLMDPTEGEILINGVPLHKIRTQWYAKIGYVPQDVYLLDDTLIENISLGAGISGAVLPKIREIINKCHLDKVFLGDDSFFIPIGNLGNTLSGGQKQRLGIARALYRNPDFLVLDEGTSALDLQTENDISETILKLSAGLTKVMVAHRMSTLANTDYTILLSDGEIRGIGRLSDMKELLKSLTH